MTASARYLAAAAILVGATTMIGAAPPASADYAPFVTIDPVKGAPGTAITVTPDSAGGCGQVYQDEVSSQIIAGGTVTVEFGSLAISPDIGGVVVLDRVLASTVVQSDDDGSWTATLVVPEGTPPGDGYAVTGHCDAEPTIFATTSTTAGSSTTAAPDAGSARHARTLLFDYFPARFSVTGTPIATTTEPATGSGARPATPVAGTADFTG